MGSERPASCFRVVLWFVAVVLVILGIIGLVIVNRPNQYYCNPHEYAVVFDGGSSHTSMAVYQWLAETITEFNTAVAWQLAYEGSCGDAGISSYADNPEGLVPGFEKCLATAQLVIPEYSHEKTPVFLGATAGMRLLNVTDPDKSDAVLGVVRETFASSPFNLPYAGEQAIILRGDKEGSSSWISANYLEANLGVEPANGDVIHDLSPIEPIPVTPTFGALDLGGASTQVTFIPENPDDIPDEYRANLGLYGHDFAQYTYSFLCYGANEARRRFEANLVKDSGFANVTFNPCSPSGYSYELTGDYLWKAPCSKGPIAMEGWGSEATPAPGVSEDDMDAMTYTLNGTGDAAQCYNLTKLLFDFDAKCDKPPCSFNGVHTPLPHGSFKALSTYAYTASGIGMPSQPTIDNFTSAGEDFCMKTYDELKMLTDKMKYKVTYCFQSMYIKALLFDAFKFDASNWDIDFPLQVNGVDLGWLLGFTINATTWVPLEQSCVGINSSTSIGLLIIFIIILLVGLLLVIYKVYRECLASEGESYRRAPSEPDQSA